MAREAMIELNCISEQKDITLLLDILCNGGWKVYNNKGNIEYLPIGDDENFCWQEDKISYEKLKEIIVMKQQKNELVGIHMFYEYTSYGISLLARNTDKVIISININRNAIDEKRDSLTNFEWYFSKLIMILYKDKSFMFSYKFKDYID